jgi:hypothetical protein
MLSSPELVAGSFQSRPTSSYKRFFTFTVEQAGIENHHEFACHRYRFE